MIYPATNSTLPSLQLPASRQAGHYGIWLAAAALLAALTLAATQTLSGPQLLCAAMLLFFTVKAYLTWMDSRETNTPVWALLCAAHFVFYGLAIFGAERESPSWYDRGAILPDSSLTAAMVVGVLGLLSMAIGRRAAVRLGYAKRVEVQLMNSAVFTPLRIRVLLLLGIAVNLLGVPFYGTSLWNVSVTLLNTIPLAAFLWLVLAALSRKMRGVDWLLAAAFFLTRIYLGASIGASLGTIAAPFLLIGLAAISVRRRLPWQMVGVVVCLVLFLQPSKTKVRKQLPHADENAEQTLITWVKTAAAGWAQVFSGDAPLESQLSPTLSRSSLLNMAGLIIDKTPSMVPYQHGAYYPLLIQNLIPRVFWPNKPSVNAANQFFQVEYGLTDEGHLSDVSIACGFEAEGYMNFGWLGVIGVGLFVGFIFAYYEHAFFSAGSTLAATAVGLALVPGFLAVESQLVQYLGGIVQILVAAVIVFRDYRNRPDVVAGN
jgi:hypothetical protein